MEPLPSALFWSSFGSLPLLTTVKKSPILKEDLENKGELVIKAERKATSTLIADLDNANVVTIWETFRELLW